MRPALLYLAVLALAGCGSGETGALRSFLAGAGDTPGTGGGRASLAQPEADAEPIRAVAIAGGDVVVTGPRGYCVDPVTVESTARGGFVMLASCRIVAGQGPDVAPALVTVTVGPRERAPVLPDAATLARFAGGPARSGASRGGLVVAHMDAGGSAVLEGGDPRYWRGAFLQGARLVSVAVYAPAGSALAEGDGADFVEAVRGAIRAASPDGTSPLGGPATGSRTE